MPGKKRKELHEITGYAFDQRVRVYEDYWGVRFEKKKDGIPIMSEDKIDKLIRHDKKKWTEEGDEKWQDEVLYAKSRECRQEQQKVQRQDRNRSGRFEEVEEELAQLGREQVVSSIMRHQQYSKDNNTANPLKRPSAQRSALQKEQEDITFELTRKDSNE